MSYEARSKRPRETIFDIPLADGLKPLAPFSNAELTMLQDALGREIPDEWPAVIWTNVGVFIERVFTDNYQRERRKRAEQRKYLKAIKEDPSILLKSEHASHPFYGVWRQIADSIATATSKRENQFIEQTAAVFNLLSDMAQKQLDTTPKGKPPDQTLNDFVEINIDVAKTLGVSLALPQLSRTGPETTPLLEFEKAALRIAIQRAREILNIENFEAFERKRLLRELRSYENKSDLALVKICNRLRRKWRRRDKGE